MSRGFNWERVRKLQRMESHGFEHALADFSDGSVQVKNPPLVPVRRRSEPAETFVQGHMASDPLAGEGSIETTVSDAAVLFAISANRYRGKWETEQDPLDVSGHLRRLIDHPSFVDAVVVIEAGESWRARSDIPRMFFREAMKLYFIAKRLRSEGCAINGPVEAAAWLLSQPGWRTQASEAATALATHAASRAEAKDIAAAAQRRRNSPPDRVERGQLGPPKYNLPVDGQISLAELRRRRKPEV